MFVSADPLENEFMNVVVSEEDEHGGGDGHAEGKDDGVEDGKFSKELFGGAVKSRWDGGDDGVARNVGRSVGRSVLQWQNVLVVVCWLVRKYISRFADWLGC